MGWWMYPKTVEYLVAPEKRRFGPQNGALAGSFIAHQHNASNFWCVWPMRSICGPLLAQSCCFSAGELLNCRPTDPLLNAPARAAATPGRRCRMPDKDRNGYSILMNVTQKTQAPPFLCAPCSAHFLPVFCHWCMSDVPHQFHA